MSGCAMSSPVLVRPIMMLSDLGTVMGCPSTMRDSAFCSGRKALPCWRRSCSSDMGSKSTLKVSCSSVRLLPQREHTVSPRLYVRPQVRQTSTSDCVSPDLGSSLVDMGKLQTNQFLSVNKDYTDRRIIPDFMAEGIPRSARQANPWEL